MYGTLHFSTLSLSFSLAPRKAAKKTMESQEADRDYQMAHILESLSEAALVNEIAGMDEVRYSLLSLRI